MVCAGCGNEIAKLEESVASLTENVLDLPLAVGFGEISADKTKEPKYGIFHKDCLFYLENTNKIKKLSVQNPIIYDAVTFARMNNYSYEQCLELMVVELAKRLACYELDILNLSLSGVGNPYNFVKD